ncbi:tetratricopeptide repeat protein [Sphingobium boeckii]|uniref:Tetratricopeptide (TPR) repeat protein n=1 Tax=Sphingobium boeckii TaxID=1082345 RepID=A0A7W9AF72_9SPHN|nr:tetratricopeptide repeat protein [Sphingobium boeckii]MBB5684354.1 tetratricopeptide (TPR) repeat protein [Sphingobium boeckii]
MILALLLAAQAALAPSPSVQDEQRFQACVSLIEADADKAITQANDWRVRGGGFAARHCLGLAYAAQARWAPAAVAFEQAAREAEAAKDARAANLWVQGGNARLAAAEYQAARGDFDAALASGVLEGDKAGEAHLDRARAAFALKDMQGARSDLDQAVKLVPADPLAWLLSATLARMMNDLDRAKADIGEATMRSPDDASVALEAGNIALLGGAPDAARTAWKSAIASQPESNAARSAAAALKALDAETP